MEQKKSFLPKIMAILATAMGILAFSSFFMEMFAVFSASTGFEAIERFSEHHSQLTIALICCIMGLIFSGVSIAKEKFAIGTIPCAVLGMCFMIAFPAKVGMGVITGFYIYLIAELLAVFFALMALTGTPASGETRKAGRVMAMIATIGACLSMVCFGLELSYNYDWWYGSDYYTGLDIIRTWRSGLYEEDYGLLFGMICSLSAILFAGFSRGRKKLAIGSVVAMPIGIVCTSICVFAYGDPEYGYFLYLVATLITIVFSIIRLAMSISSEETENNVNVCRVCGYANSRGIRFCGACGTSLSGFVCHYCGAENPNDTKFCGACGAPRMSAEIPQTAYVPASPAPVGYGTPVSTIVVCPRCRTKHPAGTSFCTTCGTSIR